jgi:hypothetical protein
MYLGTQQNIRNFVQSALNCLFRNIRLLFFDELSLNAWLGDFEKNPCPSVAE